MKKKDLILAGAVLAAAFLCWLVPRALGIFGSTPDAQLVITVNKAEYGRYDLSKDQVIRIGETNVCEIKDGEVNMIEADCLDKLCMHQGPAKEQGQTIVCLPNQVILEIVGNAQEDQIDSMVQ